MEELHLKTQLIGCGHCRFEVLVGLGVVVDHTDGEARVGILSGRVVESELVGIGIATYLCP